MKSAVPAFQQMVVRYSPDERYAAVLGDNTIYVYNLHLKQEVRRVSVPHGLSWTSLIEAQFAFDPSSNHLYVRSMQSLLDCNFQPDTECTSLRSDVNSGFDVGTDGKIAYINGDNIPTILDPRNPAVPIVFPETVPGADKDDFSWTKIDIDTAVNVHPLLVLSGSIDRTSKVPDQHGHMQTVTHTEWHTSVFDLTTNRTVFQYASVPVDVDSSALASNGHPLLCGPDQAEEEQLKDSDTEAPNRIYDVAAAKYLNPSEQSVAPRAFQKSCLAGPDIHFPNFAIPAAPSSPSLSHLPPGWKSPNGNFEITSQMSQDGGQIIYLKTLTKPVKVDILAGSAAVTNGVAFLPPARVVTRGISTHLFDFLGGTFQSFPVDLRFNADGRVYAYFLYNLAQKTWDLTIEGPQQGSRSQPGLQLKALPAWFGVSDDGSVAAYESKTILSIYANGATTKLDCSSLSFGTLHSERYPVVDPGGSSLGAFCGRDATDPTSNGLDPFFVLWDLHTLKEKTRIPATDFNKASTISWDGSTAILSGRKSLRIADATKGTFVDLPVAVGNAPTLNIAFVRLQRDGKTAVIAVNNIYGKTSGALMWVDLTTGTVVHQTSTSQLIKDLGIDAGGDVAALSTDDIVSVYGVPKTRLAQLITVGYKDWLAFSEQGTFDGSANALQWAGFRLSPNSPLMTADLFFNELYTPGLLPLVATGNAPQLPAGIHLSTYLELPGLKLMLQSGDLIPTLKNGQAVVCVQREALFATLKARQLDAVEDNDSACPRRIILSDRSDPAALVAGLKALSSARLRTPWDGLRMTGTGGTVHLLSVAVSNYSQPGLPDIPTAVPSTVRLEQVLTAHAAGDAVFDWGSTTCSGPLQNTTATKASVLSCLDKMSAAVKPSDMVILIFAGHGGTTGDSELFYYYPYGAGSSSNGISSAELADAIRRLAARRIVLIMDACDSGAAVAPLETAILAKAAQAAILPQEPGSTTASPDSTMQGVLLIAAATGLETVASDATKNPFMDKLAVLLSSNDPKSSGFSSYAMAVEMRKQLFLPTQDGSTISVQPFTSTLGADFQIVK
jgi:hypothetical protein